MMKPSLKEWTAGFFWRNEPCEVKLTENVFLGKVQESIRMQVNNRI